VWDVSYAVDITAIAILYAADYRGIYHFVLYITYILILVFNRRTAGGAKAAPPRFS